MRHPIGRRPAVSEPNDVELAALITVAGKRRLTLEEEARLRAGVERVKRQRGAASRDAKLERARAENAEDRIEDALDIAGDAGEYLYPRDAIEGMERALRGKPARQGDVPRIDRG
jgi:hypothetical protein